MFDSLSSSKERKLKGSIQKPFQKPLPPETKHYTYNKPVTHASLLSFLYALLTEFFTLFGVTLYFNAPKLFQTLRRHWNIDEFSYRSSFREPLITLTGPLGFSGASFFTTADKKYIIKSLDRKFEWAYFYKHLLLPLAEYQLSHPQSKIGHITDALFNFAPRLGRILGASCSHWLIMENAKEGEGWEDYDLKPTNYFYPERDFLGGKIASEKTKDKLFDEFEGRIPLHREVCDTLLQQLEEDSKFLCDHKVIDYSLFVLRRRHHDDRETVYGVVIDADGEWEYKFTILDYFTSTKMARTKVMKVGIRALGHGDMTITAPPQRYRDDWINMVRENIRVVAREEVKKESMETLQEDERKAQII